MCLQRQRVRFAQQKGNGSISMRWTDGAADEVEPLAAAVFRRDDGDMVVLVPAFSSSRGSRPIRPLEGGAKDATASRRVSTYAELLMRRPLVLIDRRKETCDAEME